MFADSVSKRATPFAAHHWENQHIRFAAKNGVLTLKGDVDTARQREQINDAAKNIPGVQQVVDDLQIKAKSSLPQHTGPGNLAQM